MADKQFNARIRWKRDTSANWTTNNPVLLDGEIIIVDTDSGEIRFKIGDGVKTYTQLPFEDEVVRNLINNKVDKVDGKGLSTNDYTTDEKEKLAGIEAGAQVNVQADWEQNDNTSDSYINNRPFYVIDSAEVTLLDGTFEFRQNNELYIYSQDSTTVFEIGKEYTVIFDGVSYTCTAYIVQETPVLGNNVILSSSSTDTGEPFIIGTTGTTLIVDTKLTDASHTVTIKTIKENIKKIDLKYLPDFNYLSKDSPIGTGSFSLNRKADTTVGIYSFAEGYNTTASGSNSHAEGYNTTASGSNSHAEGYNTTASGSNSHAEGTGTIASYSDSQHVQGKFNIEDLASNYAHIVGNGTPSTPSNAHTLDWSGNAWFQGDVYTGSTSGTNKDEGSKKLATEEYVDNLNSLWYGTCATAAATAAKVVTTTTGDFTLKEGATVYVLFNNDNTSTSRITLNVDGTGDTTVNLSSTNGMAAYQIAAKQVICFVYDGESFRVQGGSLATTTYYGLTKLSSSTNSTSTTMAATPSAVKEAYDLANAALPKSQLSSAVDSTSETNAATSLAVKNTFALAQSASNLASAALPISGGTMTGALISQNNTDYTTKQVRNIFLIADGVTLPSGENGDICLVYTP